MKRQNFDVYSIAIYEKRDLLGYNCRSRLPVLLGEAGFVDVRVEDRKVPLGRQWGKLGIMGSQDFVGVYRAMGIACFEEGGIGACGSRAEVESVVEQAEREWDETPGSYVPVSICDNCCGWKTPVAEKKVLVHLRD